MLELCDVFKQFGHHTAVQALSLTLKPGDFLGLIGPNGAGKSTTIKMCVGLLRPTSGSVRFQGEDVLNQPLLVRRQVGYVPENVTLYEYLSGQEFLEFVGEVKGLSASQRRSEIGELLEVLELGEERDRLIRTYSQGMRRKTALAGAMLGRPQVLVLDEALNGLDPTTCARLKGFLQQRAEEGTAVLMSSHVLEVLERLCNRIVVMKDGTLIDSCDGARLDAIRRQHGGLEGHFLALLKDPQQGRAGRSDREMPSP